MKQTIKLLVLLLSIVTATSTYAAVGRHNVTLNVGGVFNYATSGPNVGTDEQKKDATRDILGGGFNVELGYLYLSQGTLIHGFDTRASFGMNFDSIYKEGGKSLDLPSANMESWKFNTMYFQVGTTYQLGTRLGNGRILVDVVGLNLGYFTGKSTVEFPAPSGKKFVQEYGNHFLFGLNLPLGTTYIFDNGIMLGFRHRLDFAMSSNPSDTDFTGGVPNPAKDTTAGYKKGGFFGLGDKQSSGVSYNLVFSLGYAFGK